MAWLRRAALAGVAVALLSAALTLGEPSPPAARANVPCDLGSGPIDTVTGAIGVGSPVGDACNAVTDPALGLAGEALDPIKGIAGEIGNGIFNQITAWVTDGASWLVGQVVELINATTSPNLLSDGFVRQYRQMALIAVFLATLMRSSRCWRESGAATARCWPGSSWSTCRWRRSPPRSPTSWCRP